VASTALETACEITTMDTIHDDQRSSVVDAPSTTSPRGHVAPIRDAVIIVDANGRIQLANAQAEALFGYAAHELGGQPLSCLLPDTFHETHDALVAQYLAAPFPRVMAAGVQVLGRHRDGRLLPLEISLNPLQGAAPLCVLCVIRDVTTYADAEQVKQEFLRLAAHTLQTPLTALRGNVDTLLLHSTRSDAPQLAAWQQETLEEIRWATERLETLAGTLLVVTRLHAGQLELHRETHDVVALVRRVVERVRQRTYTHPLIVRVPTHVLLASIDAHLIEQTLEHLLDNAMKYSPPGKKIEIIVRRRPPERDVRILVRDHGVGIPKEHRERVFTRFGGEDNQAALAGTGLSLYLCRQFIERHGGRIGVGFTQGQGATVWFTLPLAADAESR
jgi:PAS domain S-box-containing protein